MNDQQRILVVDDQQEILDLTATVLSGAGYETATAGSGGEAIDRLSRERFDLVLLDINMPGMDGWETLRMLRADDRLEDLAVVMFSIKGEGEPIETRNRVTLCRCGGSAKKPLCDGTHYENGFEAPPNAD